MRPTPPPVTSGPAPAIHQFDVDGGAKAPPDRTETAVSNPLPHISETTVRSILHIGDNATIIRYVTEGVLYPTPIDRLVFTATSPHASIFVTQGSHDTLTIDLNHERYSVKPASDKQMIEIHTRNGHDTVYIVDTLKNPFHIETGAGNDTVVTNAQHATVLTGDGNDIVMTGAGDSYINTGAGNDIVNASSAGTTVAYTGKGADFFVAGLALTLSIPVMAMMSRSAVQATTYYVAVMAMIYSPQVPGLTLSTRARGKTSLTGSRITTKFSPKAPPVT